MNSDFRVGPWTVRPSLNTLSQNGTSARLEPKVMEVLVCLASQPGEPIAKETILKTVWPDTFVSDDVLIRSVSELRRVFQDDAREPRFIETIPKRGYRLIALVQPLNGSQPDTPHDIESRPSTEGPLPGPGRQVHSRVSNKLWILVAGAIFCAALVLAFLARQGWHGNGRPKVRTLAVLPFQSLSGDSSQEYFADGVTDALITELSHVRDLKVISRTSVMPYKKVDKSLPQIARELNADGILEGTLQRSGDRVRLTAQLIYAPADQHLWADTYQRDAADVLTMEEELATAVTREIQVHLTPEEHKIRLRRPVNIDALDAYLQGLYHRNNEPLGENGKQGIYDIETEQAEQYFRSAIGKDPNYAAAYVALGQVLAWDKSAMAAPLLWNANGVKQGRAAIEKAAALDPYAADAHMELARFAFLIDWNWPTAEREFKRALELNPNLADAHALYAEYLDAMGRLDEGQREFEILQQIDPGNHEIGDLFDHRKQFEKLVEVRETNVERHAYGQSAHYDLGFALVNAGKFKEAIDQWIETARELNYPDIADHLRVGYAKRGFQGAMRAFVADIEKYKDSPGMPTELAPYLYAHLGDKDAAFAGLDRAYRARAGCIPLLRVDSSWDPLRTDPRFKELLKRVGLPPE